jgi:hypothetical protein
MGIYNQSENVMEEEVEDTTMRIKLWGEDWVEVEKVYPCMHSSYQAEIKLEDGREYLIFDDYESAQAEVRSRWEQMDARDIIERVGEERIVDYWVSGQSFDDFVDEIVRYDTDSELASYDGSSFDVDDFNDALEEELGFKPGIAFRTN